MIEFVGCFLWMVLSSHPWQLTSSARLVETYVLLLFVRMEFAHPFWKVLNGKAQVDKNVFDLFWCFWRENYSNDPLKQEVLEHSSLNFESVLIWLRCFDLIMKKREIEESLGVDQGLLWNRLYLRLKSRGWPKEWKGSHCMKAQEEAMCASVPKSIEWPLESMSLFGLESRKNK